MVVEVAEFACGPDLGGRIRTPTTKELSYTPTMAANSLRLPPTEEVAKAAGVTKKRLLWIKKLVDRETESGAPAAERTTRKVAPPKAAERLGAATKKQIRPPKQNVRSGLAKRAFAAAAARPKSKKKGHPYLMVRELDSGTSEPNPASPSKVVPKSLSAAKSSSSAKHQSKSL